VDKLSLTLLPIEQFAPLVTSGMSNEQALQPRPVLPAEMLGMEKSLGSNAPYYFADIVGLDGDPLANIEVAIKKVRRSDEGRRSGLRHDQAGHVRRRDA
jgi:imidazolonepropionase-like amidohydrolase